MGNPFEIIDSRLSNIEGLLLSLKNSETLSRSKSEISDRCFLDEAIKVTGLSKSKLYKLTSNAKIPCKQFGSRLVFSRKELIEWLESQTVRKHSYSAAFLSLANSANRKGAIK
jgi:excisionase family DNA binding protein